MLGYSETQKHRATIVEELSSALQAMDNLMPGFDKEIARLAQRVLINPRKIDWHTGVLASKVVPGAMRFPSIHLLPTTSVICISYEQCYSLLLWRVLSSKQRFFLPPLIKKDKMGKGSDVNKRV